MAVINVNSVSQLTAALSKAQNGDVIQLASGNYSNVVLSNIKIAGNVTITSADPLKQAVLSDLTVKGSSGLTLKNLDLSNPVAGKNFAFQVLGSSNIVLDHLKVHGPNNIGSGNEVALMMVRSSSNVTVKDSEFFHGYTGISMLDNKGLTIANNYVHDLRMDGVRGGGNSDLTVTQNTFTNFHPAPLDHPDAIQLWTNNTSTSATNINITDNLVVRGNGAPIQGIFMRDIIGNLPFKNLNITGNMIVGARYNGISVEHADGATIANNTVAGFVGEQSWIRTNNSTNVTVSNNQATAFVAQQLNAAGTNGNVQIAPVFDLGMSYVSNWLASHWGFSGHWAGSDSLWMDALGLTAANLAAATALRAQVVTIDGTAGADRLFASSTNDSVVNAGDGNDSIDGGKYFNHQLNGGNGDDTYFIRSQTATVVEGAGAGCDTVRTFVDYTLAANVENLRLETGDLIGVGNDLNNTITGSMGDDTVYGMDGNDNIQGRDGDDVIYGGTGIDSLRGEIGNDSLFGEAGDDKLDGGVGNDILDGGIGNDLLLGGAGNDVMTGGAGSDIFRFYAADVAAYSFDEITDFTCGADKIDLKQIYPGGGRFTFIGTQGFHNKVGELHYTVVNGSAIVEGDVNGDGKADFAIKVDNVTKLSATDFVI
ncbi:right-handed parallel beta-helix repeat-containing protein [Sphingobium sp. DEHP117]|uniref:right-handed parallel beta-helix repeat-containing protein n=1 Tax=Sphingobium sp. DEHP117 TaxID=2993436 RepID=UPI0027D7676F|nr:right-handed parallel beta-helix repeat-containing protein [Sphingobium sp. DEHP117]MDQ4420930.1 right-handed parallel beta-helix repeat-containing protein [Sphingobium sp. DEHP117]